MKASAAAVAAALAVASGFAAPATAADLVLVCNVSQIKAGGPSVPFSRMIELTFANRDAIFHDNAGQGYKFVNRYQFVRATQSHIVLREEATTESWIDRRSGAYLYRRNDGMLIQGTCEKSQGRQRKF